MNDERITIYAELSKRQVGMLERKEATLEIPFGTSMVGKPMGRRGLMFLCSTKDSAKELVRGLDGSAINWQIQEGSLEDERT